MIDHDNPGGVGDYEMTVDRFKLTCRIKAGSAGSHSGAFTSGQMHEMHLPPRQ